MAVKYFVSLCMKISGIYQIQSKVKPERCYIGSAVCIGNRWNRHLSDLRLNRHQNKKLQNHYNKYGGVDLIFSILLGCEKEYLIANEQFFIDSYKPWFNNRPIAESNSGSIRSEETKKKMSLAQTGRICSEETKQKISKANKGTRPSEKTLKRVSEVLRGNKYNLGKHRSEESKQKSRESQLGKKRSDETKLKMRIAWTKREPMSIITKQKLSEINKGKCPSIETRKKISESLMGNIPWNKGLKLKIIS